MLATPLATAATAEHIAASLRNALLEHPHDRDTNAPSEIEEILAAVATSFEQLGAEFRANSNTATLSDRKIARLSGIIEAQRTEIERLSNLLANSQSSGKQILIAAAGGVAAAGVISGVGYFFGHGGAQIISNIWDAFGPQSVPLAPPAPAQIPFDRV